MKGKVFHFANANDILSTGRFQTPRFDEVNEKFQVQFQYKLKSAPFFPTIVLSTVTNIKGGFNLSIPTLNDASDCQLLVYRFENIKIPPTNFEVPVPNTPVFKSKVFPGSKARRNLNIYFSKIQNELLDRGRGPNQDSIITQAEVDTMANGSKDQINGATIKSLTATIYDQHIWVNTLANAQGIDAVVTFKLIPVSDTSLKDNAYLDFNIEGFDVDGQGFWGDLFQICISKDDIKRKIEAGFSQNISGLNNDIANGIKQLNDLVKASMGISPNMTASIGRFSYPVVGQNTIPMPFGPPIQVPIRAIKPEIFLGFPDFSFYA